MEDPSFQVLMIALAVATPVLAGLIHLYAKSGAMRPPRRGRVLLLALAGPVNLLFSMLLNPRLEPIRSTSMIGIVLAGIVFVIVGFGFGFLRQDKQTSGIGDEDDRAQ
jgi:uncharacterized BrkB/YihY/UPF0761 family membrane protein